MGSIFSNINQQLRIMENALNIYTPDWTFPFFVMVITWRNNQTKWGNLIPFIVYNVNENRKQRSLEIISAELITIFDYFTAIKMEGNETDF